MIVTLSLPDRYIAVTLLLTRDSHVNLDGTIRVMAGPHLDAVHVHVHVQQLYMCMHVDGKDCLE